MPRRTAVQAAQTRRAILDAGRRLFVDRGFDHVSGEELVAAAGVTRGALYHHFRDKRDVFEAIYGEVLVELDDAVADAGRRAASESGDVWAALLAGLERYLDLCLEPDIAEFALRQSPAVLGWHRWDTLDRAYSVVQLSGVLELLVATGDIEAQPIVPLAEVLVGALNQAGRLISGSDDPKAARAELGPAVMRVFEGLRVRPTPPR